VKPSEPTAYLAIVLALASAVSGTPPPKNLAAIGVVGLAGEVRRVTGVQRRFAEAHRLGFTRALVPPDWAKSWRECGGRIWPMGRRHCAR
jgi:DNA repair protein RadA/Sms